MWETGDKYPNFQIVYHMKVFLEWAIFCAYRILWRDPLNACYFKICKFNLTTKWDSCAVIEGGGETLPRHWMAGYVTVTVGVNCSYCRNELNCSYCRTELNRSYCRTELNCSYCRTELNCYYCRTEMNWTVLTAELNWTVLTAELNWTELFLLQNWT